jgi:integrase/recombinase XerD
MVLYGTGARISELLNLQVGDITHKDGVTRLHIKQKGDREHLAFIKAESLSTLRKWLQLLAPSSPNQYVFPTQHDPFKPLSYNTWQERLQVIAKDAGIRKRVYSHLFRHMRNTYLMRTVGKDKTKQIMGYALSSTIIDNYIYLTDQDATNAFLESEGLPPVTPKAIISIFGSRILGNSVMDSGKKLGLDISIFHRSRVSKVSREWKNHLLQRFHTLVEFTD